VGETIECEHSNESFFLSSIVIICFTRWF